MQILTKDKWHLFKKDGKLFEELVEELLHAEYPDVDFTHTTWTRDGGKDFETGILFFDGKLKAWAECKYHQKPLPIEDISMTLLMAYIESAHVILFFSYSKINTEFQKYIDLYKKKSDKIIRIFDDLTLEELILKHKSDIKFEKYFGHLITEGEVVTDKITYKYWINEEHLRFCNDAILHINDIIRLEFSVINHSSKQVQIDLQVIKSKYSNCFEILNSDLIQENKKTITISPQGITGITINLKLTGYSSKLSYPSILVWHDGIKKRLSINKKVACRWLAEVPLLGLDNQLLIKNLPEFLNSSYSHILMLLGESGTGKSRLISEIDSLAYELDYKRITFDADVMTHLSADKFFKKLISELEKLPDLSSVTKEYVKELCMSQQDNDKYSLFAIELLFNTNIKYLNIKDKLVDYLTYTLSRQKYYIVLDNIQFYDEVILNIMESFIDNFRDFYPSFFIFSATSNYIYEDTAADTFIRKIEWMAHKNPKQFIFKKITGFGKNDAYIYLHQCLNGVYSSENDNFDYASTLNKIIEVYGTNPFFLQNFLLCLLQENIIEHTEQSAYYINDIVALQEKIRTVPSQLLKLLEHREQLFLKNKIITEELLQKYILFVTYLAFTKWMTYQMIQKLVDIPFEIIREMEKIGLIKENENGEYGFYHQQIELYYKEKYPYKHMSQAALVNFENVALSQYNRLNYLECIFLAQYLLNKVDNEIFDIIIEKIILDDIDHQKTYDICQCVGVLLENNIFSIPIKEYINLFHHMTNLSTGRAGISLTQKLYFLLYSRFCKHPLDFELTLPETIKILKSYLVNELHLNNPQNSLVKSEELINILKNIFEERIQLDELLIELYELQIFTYNELQDINNSLLVSNLMIELAQKITKPSKLVKAWYIQGDIYYSNVYGNLYLKQICNCWNKAFEIYNNNTIEKTNRYSDKALYLNVYMRAVLLNILKKDIEKAAYYMKKLKTHIGKTQMVYFDIKLSLLYVCYNIFSIKDPSKLYMKYEDLSLHLKTSIDSCAIYGSQTMYLDCFHLLAILQRICGKNNFAIDTYEKCFSILRVMLKKQENAVHWAHFLFDMVISMRELNQKKKIPPNIWEILSTHKDISDEIKKLCTISEEKFINYIDELEFTGPLYHNEYHINFPKI